MAGFDSKAENYDRDFSNSLVGITQRKMIHNYLNDLLKNRSDLNILELNCGTGEDIPLLKKFGKVTASDVSEMMLQVSRKKNPDVDFSIIDLSKKLQVHEKYDLIFSNFGGMNCISKERLMELNVELSEILNPGGMLLVVFISKWSLVEFVYFLLKFNFKKAFRRINGMTYFNGLPIYYYSVQETKQIFHSFTLKSAFGVGKYYAGEYMNKWGPKLGLRESAPAPASSIRGADHILFSFTKK